MGTALSLYLLNLGVGLAAQLRLARLGVWHHRLYFAVFVSAAAALLLLREGWLLLTVACLALFPRARPRTWTHPALGLTGLLGYALALLGG
jgi:hypothetical protein